MPHHSESVVSRLLEKCEPITETGCWIWLGHCTYFGHGQIKHNGMACRAHRVAYEQFVGSIPDGMVVRHKCDIPQCINPKHLELGTQGDNVRDISERGRMNPKSLLNLLRKTKHRREINVRNK